MSLRRPLAAVALAVSLTLPALLPAQTPPPAASATRPSAIADLTVELASLVPADVVFYSAWAGSTRLPPEFADTHFTLLLRALDLPGWTRDTLPTILPRNAQGSPVVNQLIELAQAVVTSAWENTSAVYSTGPGVTDNLERRPQLCFLIRFTDARSADAAERDIQGRLDAIFEGNPIPNVALFRKGDTLALLVNDPSTASPLDAPASPLAASPEFAGGTAATAPGRDLPRAATVFLNLERLWTFADEENADNPEYARNMQIAGLKQARSLTISSAFDGVDYASRSLVSLAPGARTGLLGLLSSPARVDDRLYAGVPQSASSVTSLALDFPDLLARIRDEGESLRPGFKDTADAWIGLVGGALNTDFFALSQSLGREVALYALPAPAATYDFVLLNRPKDPARADQLLHGLALGVQRLLITQRPDLPRMVIDRSEHAGVTVTTAELPGKDGGPAVLSPTFAVKNGYLLLAPSRGVLTRALAEMDKGALTDAPTFTQLRARLGAPAGASLGYSDLPATAGNLYGTWSGTLNLLGGRRLAPLRNAPFPSADQLTRELSPAISAAWVDDAGLHYRTLSPYPASELLSSNLALLVGPKSLPLTLPRLQAQLRNPAGQRGR